MITHLRANGKEQLEMPTTTTTIIITRTTVTKAAEKSAVAVASTKAATAATNVHKQCNSAPGICNARKYVLLLLLLLLLLPLPLTDLSACSPDDYYEFDCMKCN